MAAAAGSLLSHHKPLGLPIQNGLKLHRVETAFGCLSGRRAVVAMLWVPFSSPIPGPLPSPSIHSLTLVGSAVSTTPVFW